MGESLRSGGLSVTAHTELVLVRHGEAERGLPAPDRGDPWLSARGKEQALLVAQELAHDEVAAVYSSHLRRAVQTAEPYCSAHGYEVGIRHGLAEFDAKAGEYMFFEDLRTNKDPRYFACMEGDLTAWGTTYEEFRDGAMEAVTEIVAAHEGKRVVLFTHGGILNVLLGHVLGLDRMWFFLPDNCGVSRVAVNPKGRMRILTMNERSHLRALQAVAPP